MGSHAKGGLLVDGEDDLYEVFLCDGELEIHYSWQNTTDLLIMATDSPNYLKRPVIEGGCHRVNPIVKVNGNEWHAKRREQRDGNEAIWT